MNSKDIFDHSVCMVWGVPPLAYSHFGYVLQTQCRVCWGGFGTFAWMQMFEKINCHSSVIHIKLSDKKLPLIASTESTISLTLWTNQPVWYGGYLPRQTRALGMYCRVWHICMNADVWKDKLSFERHPHVAANWHVKHTHNGSCRTRKRLVKSLTLQLFIHFWHRVC